MTRPAIPTPDQLDHAPELAVLAVLDASLQAAVYAVMAEQPGLRGPDHADLGSVPASHWCAERLVNLADRLLRVIDAYRTALAREHKHRLADRDDQPF
ncbi:MAG TPA: hypothetical protein VK001_08155 [Geminicoccaceae bacterium]|nr:hypothetical protein [Geminicoccaceae bacterium]